MFCTTVNVHNVRNSMHKMLIFTILKPYVHHKMWRDSRFILTDRDDELLSHQIKSEFASPNYQVISVSKLCLSYSFQWMLRAAATVEI